MKIKQHAHAVQINARPERCSAEKGGRTSVMKTMAEASEAIETRVRITTTRVRGDRIMAAGELSTRMMMFPSRIEAAAVSGRSENLNFGNGLYHLCG